MGKCETSRLVFCTFQFVIVIFCLLFTVGCSSQPSPQKTLSIFGVVTYYQTDTPARDIEVKLYTYHLNPLIEYLPPIGHILNTDITDEAGRYRLEVDVDLFNKLEKLNYQKLVVFVAQGISGFKIIDLSSGTKEVNLVNDAPAPASVK
jgi:hypothetical protein